MSEDHKNKPDIDSISGVETTGHEWDGIKELNNPAPRWWLWVFFLCCIWAFGYWFVYPTWPTLFSNGERGGTKGAYEWTQYKELKEQQAEILTKRNVHLQEFTKSSFEEIMKNPQLYTFAMGGGQSAFKSNCTTCHGTGGAGGNGYPNLNDDDWLWGGRVDDIYTTVLYGVRSNHAQTRISQMPSFKDMLDDKQINLLADYVVNKSTNQPLDETAEQLFQENCSSCHGKDARGLKEFGSPNLTDNIWLRIDGSNHSIKMQMLNPNHGVMPDWQTRLDAQTIRMLAIYVHQLGGGE